MNPVLPEGWPNAEYSQFVPSGTINWHVQDIGKGPILLFLHGAGASTHSWAPLIDYLKDQFRCIAIDLPGHGFTEGALGFQLGLAGAAHEIEKLLSKLGISPDWLVGHSAGAAIAVTLADRTQHQPIVAINGAFESFEGWAGVVFPLLAKSMVALPWVRDFMTIPMAQSADIERLLNSTGSQLDAVAVGRYRTLLKRREHITGTLGMMSQWDLARDMPKAADVHSPIHFIQAENDGTVDFKATQKFRKMVMDSSEAQFADGGHLIQETYPDRIAALIKGWVKIEKAAPS